MKNLVRISHIAIITTLLAALCVANTPVYASGATITVTGTADDATLANLNGNGTCDLREALAAANTDASVGECIAGSGTDTIAFNISGAGTHTITLEEGLAATAPVIIDGTTQTGYGGVPLIHLTETSGTSTDYMLNLETGASGSTVKGLMLSNTISTVDLLVRDGVNNVTIQANYFDTDGTAVLSGSSAGLDLNVSSNDLIGGGAAADRNIFGNTGQYAVYLQGDGSTGNLIMSNYFGVQADGLTAITGQPASGTAITIYDIGPGTISNTTIRGNIITAFGTGIWLTAKANNNLIAGNIFGLGVDGITTQGGPFTSDAIQLEGSSNTIGGVSMADRNIIAEYNIGVGFGGTASNNVIEGNYIGTDASGTLARPNNRGIDVEGSGDGNMLGGTAAGSGNLISGNSNYGIAVLSGPTHTKIFGNFIGTDASGSAALANGTAGILTWGGTADIGDATTPGNNLISGNTAHTGIVFNGGSATVFGNKIGVNVDGSTALGNGTGIYMTSASTAQIANNWIANSGSVGVNITDAASVVSSGSTNNCFVNNATFGASSVSTTPAALASNWWGATDGPGGAGSGSGDHVSTHVTFSPFLTKAPGACGPGVQLSNGAMAFGNQLAGSVSPIKTVTLKNSGALTMHISSIAASGSYLLDAAGTCPGGASTLVSGASCTIKVRFNPITTGSLPGTVTITSDTVSSPDNIALSGTGVAGTQLLPNPSFETDANNDNKPDGWSLTGFDLATDKRDCTSAKAGLCSLMLVGNGTNKMVVKSITQNGVAGDDFAFSLWSRAVSVPTGAIYRANFSVYNGSTLVSSQNMNFPVGGHTYKQRAGTFTATGPYTRLVFKITYNAPSGSVWFDLASLTWAH